MAADKTFGGNASQFFVCGELCRRGYYAVVTLGNAANTDILCSNIAGTRFVHIQVKTFLPANATCSVGIKAEKDNGSNFFWILGGIPDPPEKNFRYFIIPSAIMAENVSRAHKIWERMPGKDGRQHSQDTKFRTVHIPPAANQYSWDISEFEDRWDLIEEKLRDL